MRWRLLGLVPTMSASGADIDRSALGRLAAESVWLPSVLCLDADAWTVHGQTELIAALPVAGEVAGLALTVNELGELRSVRLKRWGEIGDGRGFDLRDFGGFVEDERSFQGYTIPSQLRVGWHPGSDRFESEGEFFRCRIEAAQFK
jgi:hypothetical protein